MVTTVVTGAAGAIGSAVVNVMLDRGHEVVGIDQHPGERTASSYHHICGDVRDGEQLRQAAASVADDADVRHFIGIAGGAIPDEVGETDLERLGVDLFRESLELNLVAQYAALRAFLPALRASTRGVDRSITLISSVNGLIGMDMPAYSAAKAGILGMVRVLARILGPDSIRVNAVAPGTVPTPRTERVWSHDPNHFERLAHHAAIGRLTTCAEVASTVYAVAVEMTAVTGQVVVVDAGQTSTWSY
jgi:NAD(P)-dependent dehydrogenase (short-subunit alcohol dehydrogenase family)